MNHARIALAVLAAGGSSRLGQPKQLLDVDGQPLLKRTLETAQRSDIDARYLVIGIYAPDIIANVNADGFHVVLNPLAHTGQASSLQAALASLEDEVDGLLVLLGDQPLVPPGLINQMASEFDPERDAAVRPRYADGPGNPILLSHKLFAEIEALEGDVGARGVLQRYADQVRTVDATLFPTPRDVDTWDDYQSLLLDWSSLGGPDFPQFCQRCGERVGRERIQQRLRPRCPACGYVYFFDPKLAVAVIVDIDGKIVMQRRAVDPGAGKWTFPSGYVDRGEVIAEAAAREVAEEVGLSIEDLKPAGLFSEPGATVALAVFHATAPGQRPMAGDETTEVLLADPRSLPPLAFPRDARLVQAWLQRRANRS